MLPCTQWSAIDSPGPCILGIECSCVGFLCQEKHAKRTQTELTWKFNCDWQLCAKKCKAFAAKFEQIKMHWKQPWVELCITFWWDQDNSNVGPILELPKAILNAFTCDFTAQTSAQFSMPNSVVKRFCIFQQVNVRSWNCDVKFKFKLSVTLLSFHSELWQHFPVQLKFFCPVLPRQWLLWICFACSRQSRGCKSILCTLVSKLLVCHKLQDVNVHLGTSWTSWTFGDVHVSDGKFFVLKILLTFCVFLTKKENRNFGRMDHQNLKIKLHWKEFEFHPMQFEFWQFILPSLLCFARNQAKNSSKNCFAHFACNENAEVLHCQTLAKCLKVSGMLFGTHSWSSKWNVDLNFSLTLTQNSNRACSACSAPKSFFLQEFTFSARIWILAGFLPEISGQILNC